MEFLKKSIHYNSSIFLFAALETRNFLDLDISSKTDLVLILSTASTPTSSSYSLEPLLLVEAGDS